MTCVLTQILLAQAKKQNKPIDHRLKCCFPRMRNQKYDSDYCIATSLCNQLYHADGNFNIPRNKKNHQNKSMMINLFASIYLIFEHCRCDEANAECTCMTSKDETINKCK